MQTHPIVLGTAGHIDHGKTALVQALTGIDTDRLKVEKERGITTELGFAHLDLAGRRYGFVDVPGHERFIKAMVAGAGGLDLVVLAIAADEGIMPQTREHLDICELLGVRRGVVALTKADLVDAEWIDLVSEEIREGLAGTFLGDAAIVPVSARSGAGLDDLRAEFIRLTAELPARPANGVFRLPLDRVFTIHGFGTVVTGTIVSGTVNLGDTAVVHPHGTQGKVRGLQVHGEDATTAPAGVRCAVNLSGVSRDQVTRGDWLAHVDGLEPSHLIDARFRYLSSSKAPLGRRNRVLLHHGTTQVLASLILVDEDQLTPGAETLVQLRIDATTPLSALPGDRFIARGFVIQEHYGTTLGGGEILRVHAPKVRRSADDAKRALHAIADARGAERVALEVKSAAAAGMRLDDLTARLGLSPQDRERTLEQLVGDGELVRVGDLLCHAEPFARMEQTVAEAVAAFEADAPHAGGMPREELRGRLPRAAAKELFDEVIAALVRRGAISAERDVVSTADRRAATKPRLSPVAEILLGHFRTWALTPPRPKDIARDTGQAEAAVKRALDELLSAGAIERIRADLYVDADAVATLRDALLAHLDAHGEITPPQWKELTGASRKFSIPLAEYFDAQKLTLRIGDIRKRRG